MEDYPRNLAEFEARFATEQACREYLCQLRWPEGFRCPRCGHDKAWAVRTALLECAGCGHQASPTAGTIFQDTRQPLQSWFRAMWWLTSQKNGASALGLQRVLGLGSYKTAWTWLHKLRRAMVRPGRDRLSGRVEVDETYLGGLEEGVRGRQTDAKALIVVAAEEDGAGIGRVRIRTIPNASGDSLMAFVGESIEPGSVVHTDGWLGYEPLEGDGYRHEVSYLEGQPARASKLLPRVHRVVSLVKRWILGTHQGAVSHEHLDSYLDEFAFRFNRRKSRSRGKLFYRLVQQAVAVPPAPYKSRSEAPRHALRTTTTCRGYFPIPESSKYPSNREIVGTARAAPMEFGLTASLRGAGGAFLIPRRRLTRRFDSPGESAKTSPARPTATFRLPRCLDGEERLLGGKHGKASTIEVPASSAPLTRRPARRNDSMTTDRSLTRPRRADSPPRGNAGRHPTPRPGRWVVLAAVLTASLGAQVPADSYRVETVRMPRDAAPEVSAIAFGVDGRLYACFRRGDIYSMDPRNGHWRKFAAGLQTPLGILPGKPGEFFVAQVPELTRVADTDADGKADVYETISDGWGLSGNYHELIAGPVRDAKGNFYVTLSLGSGLALPRFPVRGEFTKQGRRAEEPRPGRVNRVGHYSSVPYRGCSVKITPRGKVSPMSCGFRQPNGLVLSPSGELFATDNQGDWVGTSPLHHITRGAFHGHPSSLNWDASFSEDPVEALVSTLGERRKMPAIQFPQNDMAGSTAQPIFDTTGGKFGPYDGQLFIAEWSYRRILRADLETVDGVVQGASFIFLEGNGLRMANNRLAFAPDGKSLYVAQTSRVWGGSTEGLQRIRWQGKVPMDILHMRLTTSGFELTFTKPADPESLGDPAAYSFTHYYYLYHGKYGSPKTDVTPVKVVSVEVSENGRRARLELDSLPAGRVYELRPSGIVSAEGEPLTTRLATYTLNRLKK